MTQIDNCSNENITSKITKFNSCAVKNLAILLKLNQAKIAFVNDTAVYKF